VIRVRASLLVCAIGLAVAAVLVSMTAAAQAQRKPASGKASISGFVTDTNGTAIGGADVVLTSSSGAKQETKSDEKGFYSFTGIHSGTYNLSVNALSFPGMKFEYISVAAGQEIPLDATLQGVIPKPAPNAPVQSAAPAEVPSPTRGEVVPPTPAEVAPPTPAQNPAQLPAGKSTQPSVDNRGSGKAAISGIATDQTGAVLPGAKVVLSNAAGFKQETVTDEKGSYRFTDLQPGTYTLTVTAPNFEVQKLDNIAVTGGGLPLDVTLTPAKSNEEVNVVANTVGKVEVETATVSGTITQK
jgi:uncharacterized surface anchored protein